MRPSIDKERIAEPVYSIHIASAAGCAIFPITADDVFRGATVRELPFDTDFQRLAGLCSNTALRARVPLARANANASAPNGHEWRYANRHRQ